MIAAQIVQQQRLESWSGLLPSPADWGRYDAETRERILRMSEAMTSDESDRRSILVRA